MLKSLIVRYTDIRLHRLLLCVSVCVHVCLVLQVVVLQDIQLHVLCAHTVLTMSVITDEKIAKQRRTLITTNSPCLQLPWLLTCHQLLLALTVQTIKSKCPPEILRAHTGRLAKTLHVLVCVCACVCERHHFLSDSAVSSCSHTAVCDADCIIIIEQLINANIACFLIK